MEQPSVRFTAAPRGRVAVLEPLRPGNGRSRMWTRELGGRLYSFTLVDMPDGEVRVFVRVWTGTGDGPRFDCDWRYVRMWTLRPAVRGQREGGELPELGATVRLASEVNVGVIGGYREGVVVGHGAVHPEQFPVPVDLPAYAVVLVGLPDGTVVVWAPSRLVVAS